GTPVRWHAAPFQRLPFGGTRPVRGDAWPRGRRRPRTDPARGRSRAHRRALLFAPGGCRAARPSAADAARSLLRVLDAEGSLCQGQGGRSPVGAGSVRGVARSRRAGGAPAYGRRRGGGVPLVASG